MQILAFFVTILMLAGGIALIATTLSGNAAKIGLALRGNFSAPQPEYATVRRMTIRWQAPVRSVTMRALPLAA